MKRSWDTGSSADRQVHRGSASLVVLHEDYDPQQIVMLRHSKTCAMLVVCAVVCGRAEAKNGMFEEICGSIAAKNQDRPSERSIYTSRIYL